jgi:hypothetical protein
VREAYNLLLSLPQNSLIIKNIEYDGINYNGWLFKLFEQKNSDK